MLTALALIAITASFTTSIAIVVKMWLVARNQTTKGVLRVWNRSPND
jgi:hypothetical protein